MRTPAWREKPWHAAASLPRELGEEHTPLFLEKLRAQLIERFRRTDELEIAFRRVFAYGRPSMLLCLRGRGS